MTPLPKPAYQRLSDLQSGIDDYYTDTQMKAYGKAEFERALLAAMKKFEGQTMTDRELLELAAKAAGIDAEWFRGCSSLLRRGSTVAEGGLWNPLTDDGDALRLAVQLNIVVWEYGQYDRAMAEVRHGAARGEYWEIGKDPYAATRSAITRAAAEIGKGMK